MELNPENDMKKFPNKRVVITGAGSGLGRTLAVHFAKRGWRVGVSDIIMERAEETVGMVNAEGGRGLAFHCDVAKWDQVSSMAETVVSQWKGVDIVVNNAGIVSVGVMEKISLEDWQWIIGINLMGVVNGCKAFIPIFKKQGAGHIVNIASAAGIASLSEMAPYNVTKAGVISLSETLKMELFGDNIGVTVACPTFFKTNLMNQARCTDQSQLDRAAALFEKSKTTAEDVSLHIIRCIEKNRLYSLTQLDARLAWKMKRYFPELFFRLMGFLFSRGYMDKFLGVNSEEK
jgi:NAD(P)-dependent dehydrogenase (short-subunit alcohol dehydrogenase family)